MFGIQHEGGAMMTISKNESLSLTSRYFYRITEPYSITDLKILSCKSDKLRREGCQAG